jgi:hypothetical protein
MDGMSEIYRTRELAVKMEKAGRSITSHSPRRCSDFRHRKTWNKMHNQIYKSQSLTRCWGVGMEIGDFAVGHRQSPTSFAANDRKGS